MAGKLTAFELRSLLKRQGRHAVGDGLYFRVIGDAKAYWVYRYRLVGREHEISLGPYPEVGLGEARVKHLELRKLVKVNGVDPLTQRRQPRAPANPPRPMLTRVEAPGLTHLYRHYGFDGRLICVGVSNNALERWSRHKRAALWTDFVATIRIDHYPTREAAEAEAIISEKPRFNSHVVINTPELHQLRILRRSRRKVRPKAEPVAEPAP